MTGASLLRAEDTGSHGGCPACLGYGVVVVVGGGPRYRPCLGGERERAIVNAEIVAAHLDLKRTPWWQRRQRRRLRGVLDDRLRRAAEIGNGRTCDSCGRPAVEFSPDHNAHFCADCAARESCDTTETTT